MNSDENIQQAVDVGIIKSAQVETNRRLSNIEKKIDSFTFVHTDDFSEFKKTVAETYATKDQLKPISTLFWTLITALVVGLVGVGFAVLQARLK